MLIKSKMITMLLLSAFLSCPSILADETNLSLISSSNRILLVNPRYHIKAESPDKKNLKIRTTMPAALVIKPTTSTPNEEKPQDELPPLDYINSFFSPTSEEKSDYTTFFNKWKTKEERPSLDYIDSFFSPTPKEKSNYAAGSDKKETKEDFPSLDYINSFFSPVPEEKSNYTTIFNKGETKEERPSLDYINSFFSPTFKEESSYEAVINREESELTEEIDDIVLNENQILNLDGYTIGNIQIEGIKTVNPDLVYANIKTERGNLFNQEILQEDLQQIYSLGYFTDNMEIEPELRDDNTVNLKFILHENINVTDVRVMGNSTISDNELDVFVQSLKGLPQNVIKINEAIDKINNYYHSKGYLLAAVDSVTDDEDGVLTLGINEGVINRIYYEGNEKTKDFVIERSILTQAGTVYNEEYLKRDIANLYSTNIFEKVDQNIYPSPEVDGAYDVKITVKEAPQNTLSIGGGIDNALGGFGSLTYKENNFLGRGQTLSLSGVLGSGVLLSDASIKNRMNYQLELNFFEPHFINADNSLMGKLYFRELGSYQVPLAIERRFGINAGVEHKVRGHDNLSTNFSAGIEHIHLKEGDFTKISELYHIRGLDIRERSKELNGGLFFNLAPGVKYSTLDTEINPRDGIIAQAKFIEAVSLDDFSKTNGRLAGSVSKYFAVGKKSSFSLTAKGGIKVHGDDMPEVMAFRLGGPYTIRGFKMNGVGTGESFIMGSAELATPLPFVDRLKWDFIKTLRLTFFVDAGKVYDGTIASVLYDRPMSAITAGVGLRLYIPNVGPVSVDYGIPLTNCGEYGSRNGYFTFGTGVNGLGW